jgi:hypothetical protein
MLHQKSVHAPSLAIEKLVFWFGRSFLFVIDDGDGTSSSHGV